jgi:hypothetical protein
MSSRRKNSVASSVPAFSGAPLNVTVVPGTAVIGSDWSIADVSV